MQITAGTPKRRDERDGRAWLPEEKAITPRSHVRRRAAKRSCYTRRETWGLLRWNCSHLNHVATPASALKLREVMTGGGA
jgi:hypothetical protein